MNVKCKLSWILGKICGVEQCEYYDGVDEASPEG